MHLAHTSSGMCSSFVLILAKSSVNFSLELDKTCFMSILEDLARMSWTALSRDSLFGPDCWDHLIWKPLGVRNWVKQESRKLILAWRLPRAEKRRIYLL